MKISKTEASILIEQYMKAKNGERGWSMTPPDRNMSGLKMMEQAAFQEGTTCFLEDDILTIEFSEKSTENLELDIRELKYAR